jgi:hypothetical protein
MKKRVAIELYIISRVPIMPSAALLFEFASKPPHRTAGPT